MPPVPGRVYTPAWLADALIEATLGPLRDARHVLDPACGAGALLAAVARFRAREGLPPATLYGADIDAVGLAAARAALPDARLLLGDALLGATPAALARGLPDSLAERLPAPERAAWRATNRRERALAPDLRGGDAATIRARADAWCAAFLADAPPTHTAVAAALPGEAGAARSRRAFLHWHLALPDLGLDAGGGFDAVVANPPFLNQLGAHTALGRGEAALLREILPGIGAAYADVAVWMTARAWALLRPGGRLGVILPEAVLAARDAAPLRALLAREGRLDALWVADGPAFPDATVRACTLVVEKRTGRGAAAGAPRIRRSAGIPAVRAPDAVGAEAVLPDDGASWAALAAPLRGVPALPPLDGPPLSTRADSTADFRDQFYGLVPAVREGGPDAAGLPGLVPLVLTRHIDPARCAWGEVPARFAGTTYAAPAVDLAALAGGPLERWARDRLVPKLLVATQGAVVEAVADPAGAWLTTTPVVTVFPRAGETWRLLAVLLSPVATAWALTHHGGTALARDRVKLSAGQVRGLPLPDARDPAAAAAWDEAAALVQQASAAVRPDERRALLVAAAARSTAAYGADPGLVGWWSARWQPG